MRTCLQHEENSALNYLPYISPRKAKSMKSPLSLPQKHSSTAVAQSTPSLCIAVIGATGQLARRKIFPALFALYYSGYLPEVKVKVLVYFSLAFMHLTRTTSLFSVYSSECTLSLESFLVIFVTLMCCGVFSCILGHCKHGLYMMSWFPLGGWVGRAFFFGGVVVVVMVIWGRENWRTLLFYAWPLHMFKWWMNFDIAPV